jgi:hypothetical protein
MFFQGTTIVSELSPVHDKLIRNQPRRDLILLKQWLVCRCNQSLAKTTPSDDAFSRATLPAAAPHRSPYTVTVFASQVPVAVVAEEPQILLLPVKKNSLEQQPPPDRQLDSVTKSDLELNSYYPHAPEIAVH